MSEMVKNFCYPTRLARRDVIQFSVRLKNKSVAGFSHRVFQSTQYLPLSNMFYAQSIVHAINALNAATLSILFAFLFNFQFHSYCQL